MCGRYATSRSSVDLSEIFDAIDDTGDGLAPDYNVAPTKRVPIVRHDRDGGQRLLSTARWGLVPSWAREPGGGARMINARAETVATARAFASSFRRRRCLVPADGWYEWRRGEGGRQPYFMTPTDGSVLAFAGVWSVWGSGDQSVRSCAVLTTAAAGRFAAVHDRMPLVLPPDRWVGWVEAGPDADSAVLLAPPPDSYLDLLEIRPVDRAVGDVRKQGRELTARIKDSFTSPQADVADLTLF